MAEFRAGCEPTCAESSSAFDNLTITELERPTIYPAGTAIPIAPTLVGAGGYEPPLTVTEDDALGNVEIGNVLFDPEEDGLDWHESLEGMLVEIDAPEVVGLRTTFGELPVVSGGAATLRTPRGGVVIQKGDLNPERFILEDVLAPTPNAQVGDTLGDSVVAVADYGFGDYLYYPTSAPALTRGNLQREVTESPRANQLAIASMNVENLDGLDPQDKYDQLASIVVDNLRSPDILAVEEMQDNDGAPRRPRPTRGDLPAFIDDDRGRRRAALRVPSDQPQRRHGRRRGAGQHPRRLPLPHGHRCCPSWTGRARGRTRRTRCSPPARARR